MTSFRSSPAKASGREAVDLRGRHSQARHAGIDLYRDRQFLAAPRRGCPPCGELGRAVGDRHKAGFGAIVLAAGIDTVENEDFWLRAKRLPERNAFRRMRDEEDAAAFLAKGGSDLGRAEPITVRLDDGGTSGALKASLQAT